MESYIKGGGLVILKDRILKAGGLILNGVILKTRFSDSEWSRILKAGGLVILNGVVY